MTDRLPTQPTPEPAPTGAGSPNDPSTIVDYYSEAGLDYGAWSRNFNMHFGYFKPGMNPFRLEPMLERINREVVARLGLPSDQNCRLLDMGCGLGATARTVAGLLPLVRVTGITLVPWQVEKARELTAEHPRSAQLEFTQGDYCAMPYATGSFDGVYAIESCCHADGYDKADFVREAHRVLRPGQRLVVADGFLKKTTRPNALLRYCLGKLSEFWALETFPEIQRFVARLEAEGFADVEVEEVSWNIAPSVMHIPWVMTRFLFRELFRGKGRLSRRRRGHLIACLLAPIVGMARRRFGYYLIVACKKIAA